MEFHEWLKAKGFDPTDLEDKQRDSLLSAWKAEEKSKADTEKKQDAAVNASAKPLPAASGEMFDHIKLQNSRKASLSASALKFATENPDAVDGVQKILAAAVESETNQETFDLQLYRLKGERVTDNSLRHRGTIDDPEMTNTVFEAALCLSGGLKNPDKHYSDKVLEAAHKKWKSSQLGISELLLHGARSHGYTSLLHKNVEPLLRAAFSPTDFRAVGPSTFDVAGILANVANKFIVDYFSSVESVWEAIAAIRSVNDFKSIASHSLIGDYTYALIAPGGEITPATEGETTYANQAATYGRMFAIDRTDIINDDLGAFTTITRRLGRGGAIALNAIFWAAFMDNSTSFSTGNSVPLFRYCGL